MTAFMLDMMVAMMPYMKPLLWVGGLAAVAGFALMLAKPFVDANLRHKGMLWAGRIAAGLGLFFLACQGMGAILGAAPNFNLGDASKFEFIMVPFWQVGAVLFVAALFVGNALPNARQG
jgi:hypothetical protein